MKRASLFMAALMLFSCWTLFAQGETGAMTQPPRLAGYGESPARPASPQAANLFAGSVVEGEAGPEVLALSFRDAIARGLRNNLGVIFAGQGARIAEGERWRALSGILPLVTGRTAETSQQTNLEALGFPLFPGVPPVIGPFSVFDTRASVSQPVFDLAALRRLSAAKAGRESATADYRDARDTVVSLVASLYFLALSGESRVEAAASQVRTAEALYNQAVDFKNAGVIPNIELLRAQVELQSERQRLIFFQNEAERQKLALARAIGLPTGQRIQLTDKLPDSAAPTMELQTALERAYASRSDYASAQARVREAEANRKAAAAGRYPTLALTGDYGVIGRAPGNSHGTFSAAASLRVPLFQGGRVRGDVLQADALLEERKAALSELRGRIEYEVRSAFLDLQSTRDQVEVARTGQALARQQIQEAQDRFAAGVTSNIEVVQAQEALAAANENYISALYSYSIAKTSLARALGLAEESLEQFLQGGP